MDRQYKPQLIEPAVQAQWDEAAVFEVTEDPGREKFYCLAMLPYPSGRLHMGHVRNYTITDVIARFQRMQGRNVLQPMGWDAFGLPAENAAIQHGIAPARWTDENIAHMRAQLKRLGYGYDWSREVTTCRPEYYRWEQLMFVRLMHKGLAYRRNSVVNWDPVDQTVLANEQVVDGRGWRSGAPVERREIPMWFLKITDYADELLDGLEALPGWPESVKTMQANWIGRSEGLEIAFDVAGHDQPLEVFTTRPDTLMGVTYMAVAPEHALAREAAARDPDIARFVEECKRVQASEAAMETMEKRGMPLGIDALHPVSGERIPVWVANFVLIGYGTGAVMAVPGHDERDWEFATRYGLPIRPVIRPPGHARADVSAGAITEHGVLVNSGAYDGLSSAEAFDALAERFEQEGRGRRRINYRLRDWGVSRQRYWGCPIPVVHCPHCGALPVPEDQLPVELPEDVEFQGVSSPLAADADWRRTRCPGCGGPAERETDTFDTFVESSWYYARYTCPDADDILDQRADYWLPIDQYVGGIEHAVMHLLYFRFWHKLMRDAGLVSSDEPATRLLCQGMVVAETFRRESEGEVRYFAPGDVRIERDDKGAIVAATLASDGRPVTVGRVEKMSKSKNNGVDPAALIERYGADTVRLFSMFAAPPEQSLEWSDAGVEGASRFLKRLWRLLSEHLEAAPPPSGAGGASLSPEARALRRQLHETLGKVGDDLGRRYTFNTAIAAVMELVNALARFDAATESDHAVAREAWEHVLLMLNPIVPHICERLWQAMGHAGPLADAAWPEVDSAALERDVVTIVVQVNGKVRARMEAAPGAGEEELREAALADENVARFVAGKTIRKLIVVPDKLLNLVVG